MSNWLAYTEGTDYFFRREWSFTMEDDIYIRYQCFRDEKEMREAMQKRQPHKIDIGAVFSAPPKEHASLDIESFKTQERELVFDVDMTDYGRCKLIVIFIFSIGLL
jgi:DNA primase small subunit